VLDKHLQDLRKAGKKASCVVYYKTWAALVEAADQGILDAEFQGAYDTLQRLALETAERTVKEIRDAKASFVCCTSHASCVTEGTSLRRQLKQQSSCASPG
jgi:hypothetical protein